ncbi:heat shock protein 67B2 [Copidosoma floridanum]|uniref:heat shock protein 67B2 n=1 Tax=Copidosoma floridanum TaxID=29053 RepID=UPI0006C9C375|nr:heat shock protein 67B2 [Copidosoma floridanum]
MVVNKLISFRLGIILNSELRQSKKVFVSIKPLSAKCYHTLPKVLHQHSHVTPIGNRVGNCFLAPNILSRAMSGSKSLSVNYDDVVKAQGDKDILIIDVREVSEIQETGQLPGSIHIPMNDVVNELNLSKENFKNKYSREKPALADKIIVSCKSGRRSAWVQSEIQKIGYSNSYNYDGGWLDWEKHQKALNAINARKRVL